MDMPGRKVEAAVGALLLVICVAACGTVTAGDERQAAPGTSGLDSSAALRVTLLGTGNPRPSPDRYGPSLLIEAGARKLLVDAGRGAAMRLFQIGRGPMLAGVDTVLLTHLHSDHVVGFPDVWLTGWIFGRARPVAVLGPPGTVAMLQHLERAFEFDIRMRRDVDERFPAAGVALRPVDVAPGVVLDESGLKVTAFAVDHGPVAPSYGYRIDYRGRALAISGDTRALDALAEHARGVDVIVHEVVSPEVERRRAQVQDPAAIERIIARHTPPEEAGRLFARIGPRLAVYSHIVPSPATPADLIGPTRRTYTGPLAVGHDLMLITIGAQVRATTRSPLPDR